VKPPFRTPVRIARGLADPDQRFLVAADAELVLSTYDATDQELEWIVRAVNAYTEDVEP
jgi:hypothetical protein